MSILRLFWPAFWLLLSVFAVYVWVSMRRKLKRSIEVPPPDLDEDDIRRIEEAGTLRTDDPEPLDLKHISQEEDKFWGETWDEAEEV